IEQGNQAALDLEGTGVVRPATGRELPVGGNLERVVVFHLGGRLLRSGLDLIGLRFFGGLFSRSFRRRFLFGSGLLFGRLLGRSFGSGLFGSRFRGRLFSGRSERVVLCRLGGRFGGSWLDLRLGSGFFRGWFCCRFLGGRLFRGRLRSRLGRILGGIVEQVVEIVLLRSGRLFGGRFFCSGFLYCRFGSSGRLFYGRLGRFLGGRFGRLFWNRFGGRLFRSGRRRFLGSGFLGRWLSGLLRRRHRFFWQGRRRDRRRGRRRRSRGWRGGS